MILAVAATVALTVPSRDELIERWLRADRTHTLARLHAAPAAAAHASVPDLKALARRELGTRGRYALTPSAAPSKPWWSPIWGWIADRWQQFWRGLFGRVHLGKQVTASIGDLLLGLVALILAITVIRLVRNVQLARAAASSARVEPLGHAPSAAHLYRQACEAASRGDYGAAALLLFAATVALLGGRGAITTSRSATVGDLRRQLRGGDANLLDPFDVIAAPFVQRAYAERTIAEPQWKRARFAYEKLASS